MTSNGKKTLAALLAFSLFGTSAIVLAEELTRIEGSISDVHISYACGPSPTPSPPGASPGPGCATRTYMTLRYAGSGCQNDDFAIRVRRLPAVQLVTIFKKGSATGCIADSHDFSPTLSTVALDTTKIDPVRPIRVMNIVPAQSNVIAPR